MEHVDFSETYQDLWPKVYNFIYYRVQNTEEAEELTQEVFHKVFRQIKKKKVKPSKLTAYTFAAARNLVYDKWRNKGRSPKLITLEGLTQKGFELEDKKQVFEERLALQEAIDLLSAEDRTIIVLRIIEGYSVNDVAERLGRPPGTVKVLQYRALKKLKKYLEIGGYYSD